MSVIQRFHNLSPPLPLLMYIAILTVDDLLSRLRYNEDLLVNLSHEREGLEEEVEIEERQIQTLSDILEAVTL